jgi:hypothetical protein
MLKTGKKKKQSKRENPGKKTIVSINACWPYLGKKAYRFDPTPF